MIQQAIQESLKECKLNGATIFMSCSYYHCSDDSQLSVSDILKEHFTSTIGLLTDERQKLVRRRHVWADRELFCLVWQAHACSQCCRTMKWLAGM